MANRYLTTSIGRKFLMALSAIFLMIFLLQHLAINLLSVLSPDLFNSISHFMGYNPLVQFLLQPILIAAVLFHFIMGFVLEIKNKQSRGAVGYAYNNAAQNSTWVSRNMIYSGATILAFIALHFIDFWFPELAYKYVNQIPSDALRYHEELVHKFHSPIRVGAYVISFVLLSLHLLHGFQSAFQSIGARHPKYQKTIVTVGNFYGIAVPAGFIFIAIFHYVSSLS